MRIGIDFDDTIVYTSNRLKEYIENYDASKKEKKRITDNLRYIIMGDLSTLDRKLVDKIMLDVLYSLQIKENVIEVIERLKNSGHEIYIITARADMIYPGFEKATYDMLLRYKIPYNKVIFGTYDHKLSECKNNKIDLMIDDSVDIISYLIENGVNGLLMSSGVNSKIENDLPKVESWLEIEEYINKEIK